MSAAPLNTPLGISFVIPMYNEAQTIAACLTRITAVMAQDPVCPYEIILVDNGSSDDSLALASALGVAALHNPDPGSPAISRNIGAAAAQFSILSFVDADCLISHQWGSRLLGQLGESSDLAGVGAYGGPVLSPPEGSWVERAWAPIAVQPSRSESTNLAGANLALRRADFHALGGFDPHLVSAEDDQLCRRLRATGAPTVFDSDHALVHLGYPTSLTALLRKQRWQGSTQLAAHGWAGDRLVIATSLWLGAWGVIGLGSLALLIMALISQASALTPQLQLPISIVVGVAAGLLVAIPAALASRRHRHGLGASWRNFLPAFMVASVAMAGRALGLIDELCRRKDKR